MASILNPVEEAPQAAADTENEELDTNEISSDEDGKKGKKRPNPNSGNEDDKKSERRAANRRSAFQSRQRRKILIEDLQRTVGALSKDNGDLRKTNDDLRVQLEATLLENHQFRMQQQLAGAQGNPGAGLLGGNSLQSAQAQALLRSGGPGAFSQLLGGGATGQMGVPGGSAPAPCAPPPAGGLSNDSGDPLLNARLALAAVKSRGGDMAIHQSQHSAPGSAPVPAAPVAGPGPGAVQAQTPAGIQGLLNAAHFPGAPGSVPGMNHQFGGLQSFFQGGMGSNPQLPGGLQCLFENAARGAGAAGGANPAQGSQQQAGAPNSAQLAGLQGLLAQLSQGGAGAPGAPGAGQGGLSDIQRALLQGGSAPGQQAAAISQGDNKNTMSDALRALLQKSN